MKNIKIQLIILIIGIGLVFSSCSDFLDREDPSSYTQNKFWNTKEEAEASLAGCYSGLYQQGLYYNYYNSADPRALDGFGTTDGASGWWFWSPADNALAWGKLSPTSELVQVVWSACYTGIARCNEVIHFVPQMGTEKITQADAERIVGEAKFLRAFYYNYLTSLFRDVPLSKEPTLTGHIPVNKKEDVVNFITEDLKAVAESDALPVSVSDKERGRATRGAAWGLLARIYLYNEKWGDAIDATTKVSDLGYNLEGDYLKLFSEAGNRSNEVIFSVRFNSLYDDFKGFLSCRNNEEFFSPIVVTSNLLEEYYDKNGNSLSNTSFTDDQLLDPANRDPRWGYNFTHIESTWASDDWINWYQVITGRINKYQDYTVTSKSFDGQDYYVIRFADILLMRAEALANNGGAQSEIEGLINQVRDRASVQMPHVTAAEIANAGGILNLIKHERRVELAFEGYRYFDLKRWGEYDKLNEKKYVDEEKSHVWPIPQSELDNNPELKQVIEWGR